MDITYLDYRGDIYSDIINNNHISVYIFNNNKDIIEAKKYYSKPFLEKGSKFLTLTELKEKLFPVNKLELKEEKLAIIFYEILNKSEKEKLNINNYFDIIDLSAKFFNFYEELNEYNIKEFKNLQKWQQVKINIFNNIWCRYRKKMDEMGYTDKINRYNFDNFNINFLNEYNEIVFINIMNFTEKEKKILSYINDNGKRVKLYLQLNKGDFDEDKLKLKKVTLPDDYHKNLKIYSTESELMQIVNVISIGEKIKSNSTVLDTDFKNNIYKYILSSKKISSDSKTDFKYTRIYKYLNSIYKILKNSNYDVNGKLTIFIEDLINSSYQKVFKEYYDLDEEDIRYLNLLAKENYACLSLEFIRNKQELKNYRKVFTDIINIYNIKDLKELCKFLNKLNFKKLNDNLFIDDINTFISALTELYSIEEMNIVSSWENYFKDKSKGLLLLLIKYLQYKKVDNTVDKESEFNIEDIYTAASKKRINTFIINASQGKIPIGNSGNFILTDKQREELGLKTAGDKRLEEKYIFFSHILNSQFTMIFSIENLDKNITVSPFIEELIIKYNIEMSKPNINSSSYSKLISKIFNSKKDSLSSILCKENKGNSDKLIMENDDFPGSKYYISYSSYNCIKDCYYRYFIEYITGLEEERVKIEKKLSNRVIGIIVHEIFEKVIKEFKDELKKGNFNINYQQIEIIINRIYKDFKLKIPNFYNKYYKNVLLTTVKESIKELFKKLNCKIKDKIIDINTESSFRSSKAFLNLDFINFYLNGRIDFIVDTDKEKYIIDFKTGGSNLEQLDYYSLLIQNENNFESDINKYIFNVLDKSFIPGNKKGEIKLYNELSEELKKFTEKNEYSRNISSRCRRCIYLDICRAVIK